MMNVRTSLVSMVVLVLMESTVSLVVVFLGGKERIVRRMLPSATLTLAKTMQSVLTYSKITFACVLLALMESNVRLLQTDALEILA
jgi:hypothetical protein